MGKSTAEEVARWQGKVGRTVFERMMGNVSLALIKGRARTFDMGRPTTREFGDWE